MLLFTKKLNFLISRLYFVKLIFLYSSLDTTRSRNYTGNVVFFEVGTLTEPKNYNVVVQGQRKEMFQNFWTVYHFSIEITMILHLL